MPTLPILDAPLQDAQTLAAWGATLCVAPHPDDEALGCGGTLALLAQSGARVGVVWVSDGGLSHPNSPSHPRPTLTALREHEALASLEALGVPIENAFFQRLPDGALPFPGDAEFAEAVASASAILARFAPQTLLLPWRRDPHRDHRASWLIWATAARDVELRRLEYLVWAFERAAQNEWPRADEATAFRLDISAVSARKQNAIAAHASQVTRLIDDDPTAFWLSPEVLRHFQTPFESWIAPFHHAPDSGETACPTYQR